MTLAYLALVFILTFPSSLPFYHAKGNHNPSHFLLKPAQQQKHTIFLHLYTFTWILLVLATLGITKLDPGLGGGYLISAWNFCVGSSLIIGVIEGLVTSAAWKGHDEDEELPGEEVEGDLPRRSHRHVEDADESTPLLWRENEGGDSSGQVQHQHAQPKAEEEGGAGTLASWWWIPQFLISVPFPVILWGHVTMLLLDAVPQTMTDGASPWSGQFIHLYLLLGFY